MGIKFLKTSAVTSLNENIELNFDRYSSGSFLDYGLDDPTFSFESSSGVVNEQQLATLLLPVKEENFEAENSEIVFGAFSDITRYQAADPRMWAYYCHMFAIPYARARYPKRFSTDTSKEMFLASINAHFISGSQNRNLLRNNLLARLWWNARIVTDVDEKNSPELLRVLLINTDHRASFVERPTQFSTNAFKAALLYSHKKFKESQNNKYFDAPRSSKEDKKNTSHYNYRSTAAFLNRIGGSLNLNLLSHDEIMDLIANDEDKFNKSFVAEA
jgi:hypothetical protein